MQNLYDHNKWTQPIANGGYVNLYDHQILYCSLYDIKVVKF